jgi:hypothetical protein
MSKPSKFAQLEKELQPYMPIMSKAIDSILDQELSKYPIFVVHQNEIELGVEISNKNQGLGNWNIHASTLEEFSAKQIIQQEKIDSFRTIYKNPKNHLCLFILSELGAKFLFIPRK